MSMILTGRECRLLHSRLGEAREPLHGGQGQGVFGEMCMGSGSLES